jgi:uncharacterized cupredoxin-like copper-binding protein
MGDGGPAPGRPATSRAGGGAAAPAAGDHGEHGHGASSSGQTQAPERVTRTVRVTGRDTMRFDPASITVKRGETVRFVVTNAGKIEHEFMIGDREEQKAHDVMMQSTPGMKHDEANTVSLAPGKTKSLVWTFTKEGRFEAGCHVPGHYPAGMKMAITVVAGSAGKK